MKINKIADVTRFAIVKKSVKSLPNNPSEKGFKAEDIKKAMYDFVTGPNESVMAELDRVVEESNSALEEIEMNGEKFYSVNIKEKKSGNIEYYYALESTNYYYQ